MKTDSKNSDIIMMAIPCEMLLHPELLTNEQIIQVISERYLRIPNIANISRNELLEVFHHYCVPYGQRKYRDSGRGKILNRSRQLSLDKPKLETTSNGVSQNSKYSISNNKRLKSLPDLPFNQNAKRIKIDNKQNLQVHVNIDVNNKRKLLIETVTPETSPTPPKQDRKRIMWP